MVPQRTKEMKEMKDMQVVAFLRETPCADRIRRGEYEGGLYNGYVAFPNDAVKWEWPEDDDEVYDGCGYSFYEVVDMHVQVHGGITFASIDFNPYGIPMIPLTAMPEPDSMVGWTIIGFDTLHCGDTKEMWTLDALKKETMNLRDQVIALINKQK